MSILPPILEGKDHNPQESDSKAPSLPDLQKPQPEVQRKKSLLTAYFDSTDAIVSNGENAEKRLEGNTHKVISSANIRRKRKASKAHAQSEDERKDVLSLAEAIGVEEMKRLEAIFRRHNNTL